MKIPTISRKVCRVMSSFNSWYVRKKHLEDAIERGSRFNVIKERKDLTMSSASGGGTTHGIVFLDAPAP